eukprot:CAMPEP_0170057890 /NCGR_PEP_ID=MMETSP0019_2-20121128/718_1 /TAXON_ID=98059 /ORGANISM="Dinobryon sp., Strain UTEXLB2267" /LENGTH=155 /DNA_ID=CAMNT_0010262693 /DNA_START=66 /DNA_END=533 /DNA_ORIENTATION=-
MSVVPSSTHVVESSVVSSSIDTVWGLISNGSFKWWDIVLGTTLKSGNSPLELGANIEVKFKDGQSWLIHLLEISSVSKSITFEVVACEPPVAVTSILHSISLKKVTSSNATYIEWSTDFSNDATSEVVQDSSFKKLEAFAKFPVEESSSKRQRVD